MEKSDGIQRSFSWLNFYFFDIQDSRRTEQMEYSSSKEALIDRYREELFKNPHSPVFAPLGELYRQNQQLQVGKQVILEGLRKHPHSAPGYLVLAKIQKTEGLFLEAIQSLEKVLEAQPDNMQALKMGGELYLQCKFPTKALQCFKLILFYNPTDFFALNAVQKLETLTSSSYSDETFLMLDVHEWTQKNSFKNHPEVTNNNEIHNRKPSLQQSEKWIQRQMTLVDAYIARSDPEKAYQLLIQTEKIAGQSEDIEKRKKKLSLYAKPPLEKQPEVILQIKKENEFQILSKKIQFLQSLLGQLNRNKRASPIQN